MDSRANNNNLDDSIDTCVKYVNIRWQIVNVLILTMHHMEQQFELWRYKHEYSGKKS